MEQTTEELETQNAPTEPEEEVLTAEQIADLKHRAEVSSQNFERAKNAEAEKKALQEKIKELENGAEPWREPEDVTSKLAELTAKIQKIEEDRQLGEVMTKYPILRDKLSEFEQYKQEYQGVKLESVAKLFLSENDLLGDSPKRKGLEKAGGGQRVAPSEGKFTAEDAKRLRETNYKEYLKQVRSGKLQISK